jgi:(4S)-4-hydroxy-5-phosphonooxypentane-2,3-dione isomerase
MIRIVRITIEASRVQDFRDIFDQHKTHIKAMHGCQHLELWQDLESPNTFCTYSIWETPADLEAYRQSSLFREVWSKTKLWFASKPLAFSVNSLESI